MPKAKKAKRPVVMYVRVVPEEHELITQIAELRGYPHTIASVAAEAISHGLSARKLKAEAAIVKSGGRA